MLDMKELRARLAEAKENSRQRRVDVDFDALISADDRRLAFLQEVETLRCERHEIAEQTQAAKEQDARAGLVEKGKALKIALAEKEEQLALIEAEWRAWMLRVPNWTHPDAPVGEDDHGNQEVAVHGTIPVLTFSPKSHVVLGESLDVIDFKRGATVTGAKFYFLKGRLALLEQALIQYAMKELVAERFIPMITPDLAKDEVLVGTGFHPRGPEAQIYSVMDSDLSLIGTAEITLGGYHRGELIPEERFPLKYLGLSHCFRTEAGTYGRESYGLYRVHQFNKLEMFVYALPEQSQVLHEELRQLEERLYAKLGLIFRTVDTCTGDLGGPAYRKYDIEAWMWGKGEGKGDWGEITSASNCTDCQARRLNVRVKRDDGATCFAHTLNGTAVATSRALIAIMEQYQQADGSIRVPEVLQPFCGFDVIK